MPHIICLGSAVLDAIYSVPAIPRAPVKVLATAYNEAGGGMAATAATTACRMGSTAALWSRIGDDSIADRIQAELRDYGVDITHVRRMPGCISTHSAVLVDPHGERQITGFMDPGIPAAADWLPLDHVAGADAVMVDQRWVEGARALLQEARRQGVPSVLDFDMAEGPAAEALLALADHAIFSEQALRALSGADEPEAGLRQVAARVPDTVVGVTAGERGFLYLEGEALRAVPAPAVNVVDTLGAGDVFHGALTVALAEHRPLAEAARFANATASLKCTRPGGRHGTPTRAEVEALLRAE